MSGIDKKNWIFEAFCILAKNIENDWVPLIDFAKSGISLWIFTLLNNWYAERIVNSNDSDNISYKLSEKW